MPEAANDRNRELWIDESMWATAAPGCPESECSV